MYAKSRRFLTLALAAALTTTACSDTGLTGPDLTADDFDADSASANFEAMNEVFESDVWDSFGVLGELFPIGSSAARAAFAVQATADLTADRSTYASQRYARWVAENLALRVPRIPDEVRGITFVLDPETLDYVASDLPGAPETGVRFILYAINPVTHQPLPDVPIGHADLIDLGDDLENGVSLRFIVVSNDVTHFDYTVTAVHTEAGGSLDVAGLIGNGDTFIEFDIGVDAERTDASHVMEVAFEIAVPARNFSASGTVRNEESEAEGASHSVDVEIHIGDHVITVSTTGTPEEISGEIHVNGELFALISGDPEEPTITGPDGRDLTERERRVLRHIVNLVERVFRMFEHLLRPAERILDLGVFR